MADLTVLGLGSFGDAEFPYIMQTFEPALPVPSVPIQTVITGCRITGVDESQEGDSPDELVTEFTAQALYLIRFYGPLPLKLWSTIRTLLP